ncbi:hypothetical protein B0H19DRAFT_1083747 [Mycena capillaripes]|nr:hypothetical protein B0H19DRAFT_1083747 [Mycena capillaripes]
MLARQFVSVLRTHLRNPDTTARAPPHIEPGAHYHPAYGTAYEYLASSTHSLVLLAAERDVKKCTGTNPVIVFPRKKDDRLQRDGLHAFIKTEKESQHPALVELPGLLGWRSMTVQCRRIGCSKGQVKAVHGDAQQVQHRADETQESSNILCTCSSRRIVSVVLLTSGSHLFNFIQRKADWEGSCRSVCNSELELVNKEVPGNKRGQALDSPFNAVEVEESTYDLRRASGVDPLDIPHAMNQQWYRAFLIQKNTFNLANHFGNRSAQNTTVSEIADARPIQFISYVASSSALTIQFSATSNNPALSLPLNRQSPPSKVSQSGLHSGSMYDIDSQHILSFPIRCSRFSEATRWVRRTSDVKLLLLTHIQHTGVLRATPYALLPLSPRRRLRRIGSIIRTIFIELYEQTDTSRSRSWIPEARASLSRREERLEYEAPASALIHVTLFIRVIIDLFLDALIASSHPYSYLTLLYLKTQNSVSRPQIPIAHVWLFQSIPLQDLNIHCVL